MEILKSTSRASNDLEFQKYFNTVVFYQKANLGQLTAKSEKAEFFWDTLLFTYPFSDIVRVWSINLSLNMPKNALFLLKNVKKSARHRSHVAYCVIYITTSLYNNEKVYRQLIVRENKVRFAYWCDFNTKKVNWKKKVNWSTCG